MSKYQSQLNSLKELGVSKAEVEFSGGNDEGGIDAIIIDGEHATSNWDGIYKDTNLGEPIFDRYYSFAGEFEVWGKFIFDVENNKAFFQAQESHVSFDPVNDEV
jgi:hypothetical protein